LVRFEFITDVDGEKVLKITWYLMN